MIEYAHKYITADARLIDNSFNLEAIKKWNYKI